MHQAGLTCYFHMACYLINRDIIRLAILCIYCKVCLAVLSHRFPYNTQIALLQVIQVDVTRHSYAGRWIQKPAISSK
jgi:hypothetical protein